MKCIDLALQDGHVLITRYGKPVAAIVSFDDLEQLQRIRAARETGGLADLAEGWENASSCRSPNGCHRTKHHLEVVTGNVRHFGRVPNLDVNLILADSRQNS